MKLDLERAEILLAQGLSVSEVAGRLGVTKQAIYLRLPPDRQPSAIARAAKPVPPPAPVIDFKPSSAPGRINAADLRRLVRAGSSTGAIAAFFRVQPPAVVRACHAAGLALPGRGNGAAGAVVAPDVPLPPESPDPCPAPAPEAAGPMSVPAGLVATGGRHVDLSDWAAANGLTITQARAAWFRLRLPTVAKKGL